MTLYVLPTLENKLKKTSFVFSLYNTLITCIHLLSKSVMSVYFYSVNNQLIINLNANLTD
jgi:hypothetical protein